MVAAILSIMSAKATGNEVMVTPTQLHATVSAIIPTIRAMTTMFFEMMMNNKQVKLLSAPVSVYKATQ
jgi:hypothetical protein